MKKCIWIVWVCLLGMVSFSGDVQADPPYGFTLVDIKFNHNTSSNSTDRVTIQKNESDITAPEWITSSQTNDPIAYIKGSNKTILASFTCTSDTVTSAKIFATKTAGDILTHIGEETITFSNGWSSPLYQQFTVTDVPTWVKKGTVTWQWKFKVGLYSEQPITSTGPHTIYVLVASPQAPMSKPWTEVLDYSCVWAAWQPGAVGAATKIVQKIYSDIGLSYDTENGAPVYTGWGNTDFNLNLFLSRIPNVGKFNCYDSGKAVKIFGNAVGSGSSYKFSSPFGYLNCIKPAGKGWANNPFYDGGPPISSDPIVGEDDDWNDGRSKFGNHAFGALNSNIYDASLRVDTDPNPDAPPHSPSDGSWATGWSWSIYKAKVVDDNPSTSTGDPSGYNNWGVY